jgi:hypothetical protein
MNRFLSHWLLLALLVGCASPKLAPDGVYKGDALLYEVEAGIPAAHDICVAFLQWEKAYLPFLKKRPEVTKAANHIRANLKKWEQSAHNLRDAYVAAPTAESRDALLKALAVLRQALLEAASYMAAPTKPN